MQGDFVVDKENVGPRGSSAWSQQAMLAKNKGMGGGHDVVRKDRSGVLASNATINNGASGPGPLELLKERVKLLKLSSTSGVAWESGSRLLKHRSPLVDIQSSEGTVNSSVASLLSKDGTGHMTTLERSSSQSQEIPSFYRLSNCRPNGSEPSERNIKSSLHSSGGRIGSKSDGPGSSKVLELYQENTDKTRRNRREASRSRVDAWVNTVVQTSQQRESVSPVGSATEEHVKANRNLGTAQHQLESRFDNPQSSSTSRDSGVWTGSQRQGTPYKRRLPLSEEEKVSRISQVDEAESNNNGGRVAGHKSPPAAVSSKSIHNKEVEYFQARKENKVGVHTSSEGNLKNVDTKLLNGVSDKRTLDYFGSGIPTSAEEGGSVSGLGAGGLRENKIILSESIKVTRSSGLSLQEDQHEKESSKWGSSLANADGTTFAPSSSFLLSKMTGASSSGSSATPGFSAGSSKDDDTVGYLDSSKEETPSPEEHAILSSREQTSSRRRISKRIKAQGPASRLLIYGRARRVAVEDGGSSAPKDDGSPSSVILRAEIGSSPLETGVGSVLKAHSPTTPEKAEKYPGTDLLVDFKKRKAEDDPSIGDVSQAENVQGIKNRSPCDNVIQSAVPSRSDYGESQLAKRTLLPDGSPEIAQSVKGVSKKSPDVSTVVSILSRETPESLYRGLGSSQILKDMVSLQQTLLDREVTPLNQPIGGTGRSVNNHSLQAKPKSSPYVDSRRRSSEPDGSRDSPSKRAASDVKEASEAVSMSQDGLSLRDKSDKRLGSAQDISGSLGSMSLGERDVQTKAQSKLSFPSNLVNNFSSNPPLGTVNQNNIKILENCGVFHNSSHSSGRSAVTTENEPRSEHSKSLLSEKPRIELSGAGKENHVKEVKGTSLKPVLPGGTSEAAASNAPRPSEDPREEDGEGAVLTTQRKALEYGKYFWVNNVRYKKLGMIGKGGSSEVYKVIDSKSSIYALKKITLGGRDHSTALGFYQEIEYLERLRGKRHIVQLIDYDVSERFVVDENYGEEKMQEGACIYMVLEIGEIDLAGILNNRRKEMLESNEPQDDNWIRFYWKDMLLAVKTIHEERIVHADLKPANFLLVKGELKLIDFGIAKAIQTDMTHVVRDSQVGTVNYMPPEALMNNSKDEDGRAFKCGRSSDIWSLGCILYQMVYGHTPYSHIRNFIPKIQAITSKSFKIDYPPIRDPCLLDVMKRCLTWDRHSRPDIAQLLVHPFLRPDLVPQK